MEIVKNKEIEAFTLLEHALVFIATETVAFCPDCENVFSENIDEYHRNYHAETKFKEYKRYSVEVDFSVGKSGEYKQFQRLFTPVKIDGLSYLNAWRQYNLAVELAEKIFNN